MKSMQKLSTDSTVLISVTNSKLKMKKLLRKSSKNLLKKSLKNLLKKRAKMKHQKMLRRLKLRQSNSEKTSCSESWKNMESKIVTLS